jgi:hypothetical protein
LLNVVLAVALILLGHLLRQRWQETKSHEASVLLKPNPPAPPPPIAPRPMVPKLQPTSYVEVAQKVLFARDRNPDVIPEPPKPPPPPPPVPPFPAAHGVMIFGNVPPTIILSVGKGEQRAFQAGDKVGEFEIASLTDQQIVFTWEDKTFVKNISDLEVAAPAAPAEKQQTQNTPPPADATVKSLAPQTGPGMNVSNDGKVKTCDQNDPTPVGTVVDGYRKVAVPSPMGAHFCRWQAVN